ncbi:hypothetical protein AAWM_01855 [Aspergillus awamori]|uniref:Uncharacterized protein n=1 Tax=Aspergillus awamori TaxID=105351 RepID=A0A401KHV7_ASPAW|nr:hypothetical protein AAWM_01855 [Aspergillus awamori]
MNENADSKHGLEELNQITMDNGREIIAKLPNPNAGRPHFTAASEVATMDFSRNTLNLPVPRVLKWKRKVHVLGQIVDIQRRLAGARFAKFGSLYHGDDIPDNAYSNPSLYFDSAGNKRRSKRFCIGTLTTALSLALAVIELVTAIAKRKIATAKAGIQYASMPDGLFYGPRKYQPSLWKKVSALQNDLQVVPHVLPETELHMHRFYGMAISIRRISLLGTLRFSIITDRFLKIWERFPHHQIYRMDADEQRKAKALHRAQTLHNLYLVRWLQANETVFQSLHSPNTLRHQVSVVPGLVLMDYEPLLNSLLRDVRKNWADIVGLGSDDSSPRIPCPLQSSMEEVQQREEDGDLWAQGVALMDTLISDTGFFKHWDGIIDEIDYERSRKELGRGVVRFLEREARNDDERREWLNALKFVD